MSRPHRRLPADPQHRRASSPAAAAKPAAPAGAAAPRRRVPVHRCPEVFERVGRQGTHAYLPRPVQANKAGSGNGGLHWIQKGGGYYSECNAKLKG